MSKTVRRVLIGASVFAGALVVLILCVALFFDVNSYKPQIEGAVAKATGMNLKINGKVSLKLIPHVRVSLDEVQLSHGGTELLVTKELEVSPRLFPFLFHRKVVIDQVSLLSPKLQIEKSTSGHMNFETGRSSTESTGSPGEVNSIKIRDGHLAYLDRATGENIQVAGLNLSLSGVSWKAANEMKSLKFHGNAEAQSLKIGNKKGITTASRLKATIRDDHGLIHLDPTEVSIFGGVLRGSGQIDLRGATPKIEIAQTASGIDLDQAAPKLKNKLSGTMDGSVKLTGSGKSAQAITKTMSGTVSIHSQNIATPIDVEALATKLKTAQGMDLVGLGSSLFSSPLSETSGQAAGIASGAQQPKTKILDLVSNWNIHNGIAEAKDVAFSTAKTTVAFKGDLNLIDKKYQNFYVATVDQKGCAKTKVEVGGSLDHPQPVAGSIGRQLSKSYLGSVGSEVAGIFGGNDESRSDTNSASKESTQGCDKFYSGSVIHAG